MQLKHPAQSLRHAPRSLKGGSGVTLQHSWGPLLSQVLLPSELQLLCETLSMSRYPCLFPTPPPHIPTRGLNAGGCFSF